jgi:ATP synthase protein I
MLGVGGWLFVIPVVGGAYLGRYLDGRFRDGQSWTITFIVLGLVVGVYNFWFYYRRRS